MNQLLKILKDDSGDICFFIGAGISKPPPKVGGCLVSNPPNFWESVEAFVPFVGSGTTTYVAMLLGRKGIGIDINPRHIETAEGSIL